MKSYVLAKDTPFASAGTEVYNIYGKNEFTEDPYILSYYPRDVFIMQDFGVYGYSYYKRLTQIPDKTMIFIGDIKDLITKKWVKEVETIVFYVAKGTKYRVEEI